MSRRLSNACQKAITSINPVAPPEEVAEALKRIAIRHRLDKEEIEQLIRFFFSYHEIDIFGSPPVAILRSGYQILAEDDEPKVLDHLINAIVGESFARAWRTAGDEMPDVGKELVKEVEHIRDSVHDVIARALFGLLLYDAVHARFLKILAGLIANLTGEEVSQEQLNKDPSGEILSMVMKTKKNTVLLLGKDSDEGLEVLLDIRKYVEQHGLRCLLVKEMPEHLETSLITKVLLCAMLSRFVIMENTFPSGHLYELPFVRNAEAVIAILQQEGTGATWMFDDMIPKHPLVQRFWYTNESLSEMVTAAIQWAERRIAENVRINKAAWPWT